MFSIQFTDRMVNNSVKYKLKIPVLESSGKIRRNFSSYLDSFKPPSKLTQEALV